MPVLNGCQAGTRYAKPGDEVEVYCNGFEMKKLTKKDGTVVLDKVTNQPIIKLIGFFGDNDKVYEKDFGSTSSINIDAINNVLDCLNKPLVDENSIQTLDTPDKGEARADWSNPLLAVFEEDKNNPKYTRLAYFKKITLQN